MPEVTYTREFWEEALRLASVGNKQCEGCHGFTILKGVGRRTVRVVLKSEGWPVKHRLYLLCTTCHPDPKDKTFSRKAILAKIAELPFDLNSENSATGTGI